jgi:hypothetical protein
MAPGKYLPEYSMPLDRWVVVPVMELLPPRTRLRIEAVLHRAYLTASVQLGAQIGQSLGGFRVSVRSHLAAVVSGRRGVRGGT